MKTLTQHLNEKLIINKNYKNVDSIESLFENVDFKRDKDNELTTSDDIFSIMVNYIRDNNIRRFPDFDSYHKTGTEVLKKCLVLFKKRIKQIDIFQKTRNNTYMDSYTNFTIYERSDENIQAFKRKKCDILQMSALRPGKIWNDVNNFEYYEISKETFNDLSKLYDKLGRK